jgi:hypothetical protein
MRSGQHQTSGTSGAERGLPAAAPLMTQIDRKRSFDKMIKKPKSVVLIGTSGWSYKSWSGSFFPPQLPTRLHLDYYSQHFPTTELDGVFYRTPTTKAVRVWAEQTRQEFVFAWETSKFITHWQGDATWR